MDPLQIRSPLQRRLEGKREGEAEIGLRVAERRRRLRGRVERAATIEIEDQVVTKVNAGRREERKKRRNRNGGGEGRPREMRVEETWELRAKTSCRNLQRLSSDF